VISRVPFAAEQFSSIVQVRYAKIMIRRYFITIAFLFLVAAILSCGDSPFDESRKDPRNGFGLELGRIDRPQDPVPPYPYYQREVMITTNSAGVESFLSNGHYRQS